MQLDSKLYVVLSTAMRVFTRGFGPVERCAISVFQPNRRLQVNCGSSPRGL